MEVDKVSFYPLLLDILTDISESHFVAVDLELSGVPSKQTGSHGAGRPTLQQRYIETKEAAERYQILQIGLTCVQQDVENGKYILKPYNFELSPLIDEQRLDIERIFSFQSGAAEFLLKAGFDMSVPFQHGIPYLSRAESREARERYARRQDKSAVADIQLKPTETESLAFLERIRGEIDAWLASRAFEVPEYVNIGATTKGDDVVVNNNSDPPQELSRFEKRLVHQLVRAEYPELVTMTKRGFVQIIRYDKEREDRYAADRKRELHERIGRQKGFRWIIEALHGSDISNIDLKECAKDPVTGESVFADLNDFKAQFHRAHTIMRGNPRVLVGHNCFLDLVYTYRTFIGELPDTVEEFQQKIHRLWPMVVDTKYMSTHNCGDINPVSSLEQIAQQLSEQEKPVMEVDVEHKKYEKEEMLHEAGYDSFLTAQIAVRLAAKLEGEGKYVEVNNGAVNNQESAEQNADPADNVTAKLTATTLSTHNYHTTNGTVPLTDPDSFTPSVEGAKWKRTGDPTLPPPNPDDPFEYNPADRKHRLPVRSEGGFEGGMPSFDSDFWRVYGNKLRVFGTEEAVCVLDAGDDELSDAVGDGDGGVEVDV